MKKQTIFYSIAGIATLIYDTIRSMNFQTKLSTAMIMALLFVGVAPFFVSAHPGRTASDGCHYCRTNCDYWGVPWNERHCHGGTTIEPPPTPPTTPIAPSSQPVIPIVLPATPISPQPKSTDESTQVFTVTRVIDGDTIEILYSDTKRKIRLIGIDTPETVDPRKLIQCFGKEASEKTKSLLKDRHVWLQKDSIGDTIDKYGRLLRYVYRYPDSLFINAELIKQGYAYVYLTYPFSKSEEFKTYQAEAKEKELGLWAPAVRGNSQVINQSQSGLQENPSATVSQPSKGRLYRLLSKPFFWR